MFIPSPTDGTVENALDQALDRIAERDPGLGHFIEAMQMVIDSLQPPSPHTHGPDETALH
jgi:hypothetical protein